MSQTILDHINEELSSYQDLIVMIEETRNALDLIKRESVKFEKLVVQNPDLSTMSERDLLIHNMELQKTHANITIGGLKATGTQLKVQLDKIEESVQREISELENKLEQLEKLESGQSQLENLKDDQTPA